MALHGEEPVEIMINDQVFYLGGDLMIPRPDSRVDMRQGPSGPGPRPDHGGKEGDPKKKIRER